MELMCKAISINLKTDLKQVNTYCDLPVLVLYKNKLLSACSSSFISK